MLQTLKKFFAFCGKENRKLFVTSIWLGVVSAICSAMRIPAAAIVIQALLQKNVTMATLWTSLGIIVASLIVTIAINMKATMLQTRAGYRACANKRIEIAEHLRYLPMGWFNDNSLGEVTSVTTNTMENMANIATRVVMVTTRGFLTSGIIAAMMFLFDWRMGLITLAGLLLFFAVNAAMQRAEQALSQRKFNADERLVSKVLEYVQGIAEVKNFDLTHDSATQVHGAVEEARKASFAMEIPSVLYMLAQFIVNKLTGVAVCIAAIVFYFGGTLTIDLDGTGKADLHTGIGFFDHMLDGFARHGLFDLTVQCRGDLEVDCHHTIEDVGIALGTAIKEALGDKAGLVRYGSCLLPMDETLTLCAVDLGGRPYFVYDASFAGQSCGGMDVQMAREFFYAISYAAMMNLHLKVLYGENDHHKLEAMFKAFAKALDAATRKDARIDGVLSTKGTL